MNDDDTALIPLSNIRRPWNWNNSIIIIIIIKYVYLLREEIKRRIGRADELFDGWRPEPS